MAAKPKIVKRGKSFEQRFIEELERQCAGEDIAILNKTLREQLGWQNDRFDDVRSSLIKKGVIQPAPGPGGKTRFAQFHAEKPKKKSLRLFLSYSHADEALKDQLVKHLRPLERLGLISSWHDRHIKPGENFAQAIDKEIETADLILLLVSVDFINSNYCYDVEMARAIERHYSKSARVIPVILRSCLWNHAPFGGIQAVPKDAIAVAMAANQDEAFTSIAKQLHELAVEVLAA